MAEAERVVCCIPTCGRPERLLSNLQRVGQVLPAGSLIVVGDNLCDARLRRTLSSLELVHSRVNYLEVSERNISANRNACAAAALALAPNADWVAFLDDDIEVPLNWWNCLIDVARATDADVVGAPSVPIGCNRSLWLEVGLAEFRRGGKSGPVDVLSSGGNFIVKSEWLRRLGDELFRLDLGLTGGEDAELFLRLKAAGATFAWCAEAESIEHIEKDRSTAVAVAWRAFTTGCACATFQGNGVNILSRFISVASALVRAVGAIILAILWRDWKRCVRSVLGAAYSLGQILALFGVKFERYATPRKPA